MAPMHPQNSDLDLMHLLADCASDAILPHFRALPGVENKAQQGFDPVTVADREAERAIRDSLADHRPQDGIFGEEFPPTAGTSGRTWILDPIDGTRGFMAGLPTWGVLIAVAEGAEPVAGMMAQPLVRERFYAGPGGAFMDSYRGTEAIATRSCRRLEDAVVACTAPQDFDQTMLDLVERLSRRVRLVRFGVDCYGYAVLAAGHVDIVIETGLKPFDIAPFVPIVERSGGVLLDRHGERIGGTILDGYGGDGIAVGDPALVDALMAELG
ncbi:MAG: inositol monophosphatase family protein [Pseudomonadota bacterium]